MRALRLESIGNLQAVQLPVPQACAERDEVVLKVTHCALCRTDAKMWRWGHRALTMPRVLGHEICGTLDTEGGHHVVWPGTACGTCKPCTRGMENLCPSIQIIGFHRDGGLAEHVVLPRESLLPVPPKVRPDLAVLAEPMACTLNALHQARVAQGDKVLVYGAGPVGLMMSLALVAMGAEPSLVENASARLHKIAPIVRQAGLRLHRIPPDESFRVALNATPSMAVVPDGLSRLEPGGTFCVFSGLDGSLQFPSSLLNEIHYRQLTVVGAYGCTRAHMEEALKLIALHWDKMELLVEGLVGLEGVSEILPAMLRGELLKIVVYLRQ